MYPAERTLTNSIRQTLYMLKRQFGGTINIYTIGSASTDPRTGVVTETRSVVKIARAAILPARISREVKRSISQISANKMFVVGGTYDAGRRLFIVDRNDVPDLTLTNNSYIVYKNRKYEVEEVQEFEFEAGWTITGRELVGEIPEQIHVLYADNLIRLVQGLEAT
jgi:hypothetical protein